MCRGRGRRKINEFTDPGAPVLHPLPTRGRHLLLPVGGWVVDDGWRLSLMLVARCVRAYFVVLPGARANKQFMAIVMLHAGIVVALFSLLSSVN